MKAQGQEDNSMFVLPIETMVEVLGYHISKQVSGFYLPEIPLLRLSEQHTFKDKAPVKKTRFN